MSTRQTRFARAFVPWIAEWSRAGLSGTQERVMLLLATHMERGGDGQYTAWMPRSEMAEVLGVSELTVRDAIQKLKRKGMLKMLGGAHCGRAQKYVLMPTGKGYAQRLPIKEKGCAEELKKGVLTHSERVSATAHPSRTLEGATAAPSKVLPSAKELYPGNKVV